MDLAHSSFELLPRLRRASPSTSLDKICAVFVYCFRLSLDATHVNLFVDWTMFKMSFYFPLPRSDVKSALASVSLTQKTNYSKVILCSCISYSHHQLRWVKVSSQIIYLLLPSYSLLIRFYLELTQRTKVIRLAY